MNKQSLLNMRKLQKRLDLINLIFMKSEYRLKIKTIHQIINTIPIERVNFKVQLCNYDKIIEIKNRKNIVEYIEFDGNILMCINENNYDLVYNDYTIYLCIKNAEILDDDDKNIKQLCLLKEIHYEYFINSHIWKEDNSYLDMRHCIIDEDDLDYLTNKIMKINSIKENYKYDEIYKALQDIEKHSGKGYYKKYNISVVYSADELINHLIVRDFKQHSKGCYHSKITTRERRYFQNIKFGYFYGRYSILGPEEAYIDYKFNLDKNAIISYVQNSIDTYTDETFNETEHNIVIYSPSIGYKFSVVNKCIYDIIKQNDYVLKTYQYENAIYDKLKDKCEF